MAGNYWRFVSVALLSGALLAGCGGGETSAQDQGSAAPPPSASPAPTTPGTGSSPDTATPPTAGPTTPDPAVPPAGSGTPPAATTGIATLQWNVPTEFTDGSLLSATELAGFSIYHGDNSAEMTRVAEVDAQATSLVVKDLATGTHYFAVAAISASGEIGEMSAVLSKTVM